jgi:UDPglucose--hexose-1-phosphate uridylyltransferase
MIKTTCTSLKSRVLLVGGEQLFEKHKVDARFLSPVNGFEEDIQTIEYRRDTLMDMWCRVNVKRAVRKKQARGEQNLYELIEASKADCSFCPGNIEHATPKFLPDISEEGRIKMGEAVVFPNLFPFAKYHAMAAVSEKHFLGIGDFTKDQIEDAINASIEFFKRIEALGAKYFSLNWNHLPPSGASVIHSHFQLIGDEVPTHMMGTYLDASKRYYEEKGENYWLQLIKEEEKNGERFIGKTGKAVWISSFAPLGNSEISMVFEGCSSILDLTKEDVSDIADGLLRIFKGYSGMGKTSFNFSVYSGQRNMEDFCLNAKIITRPNAQKYFTADSGFMEALHKERIVETLPESLAEDFRRYF